MKLDINMQKAAIIEMGSYLSNELFKSEGLELLADKWELSDKQISIVGENGKIELPFDYKSDNIDYIETSTLEKIEDLQALIDELFKGRSRFAPGIDIKGSRLNIEDLFIIEGGKSPKLLKKRKSFNKSLKYYISMTYKDETPDKSLLNKIENSRIDLEQELSRRVAKSGKIVISALPQDILTASVSGYGWGSCFTPKQDHEISPYGYLMGGEILIAYFTPTGGSRLDYNFGEVDKKMWRTWIFFNNKGELTLPMEGYPSNSRGMMDKIISELLKIKGQDFLEKKVEVKTNDALYYDDLDIIITNDSDYTNRSISNDYLKCLITGKDLKRYASYTQSLVDLQDFGYEGCENCESYFHIDKLNGAINANKEEYYICADCIDDYVYSEVEGSYLLREVAEDYIIDGDNSIKKGLLSSINKIDNMYYIEYSYSGCYIQNYKESDKDVYLNLIYEEYGVKTDITHVEKVDTSCINML